MSMQRLSKLAHGDCVRTVCIFRHQWGERPMSRSIASSLDWIVLLISHQDQPGPYPWLELDAQAAS